MYPYGAIKIGIETTDPFKVNRFRLKHYIVGELREGKVICALPDVSSPYRFLSISSGPKPSASWEATQASLLSKKWKKKERKTMKMTKKGGRRGKVCTKNE